MTDDLEAERALGSHVKWVLDTLDVYEARGYSGMNERIDGLSDREKDSLLRFLLVMQNMGLVSEMRKQLRAPRPSGFATMSVS